MLAQHCVLIIDDQPLVRKVLRSMLANLGCETVTEASNGEEALLSMQQSPPTLILCDINMSPIDGFDFLSNLRIGKYGAQDVPVIFLTCNTERKIVERAIKMGVAGYLLKPVTSEELRTKISTALDSRIRL